MLGIIIFIISLILSITSGSILMYSRTYLNVPFGINITVIILYIISFLMLILSIIFIRKNIKYLAIIGSILLFVSIVLLLVGILVINIYTYISILIIIPSFYIFMYGFITDLKYHNNVFYKLI